MKTEKYMTYYTSQTLCEYIMLKKAIKIYKQKFDCSYSKYIKIKPVAHFLFRNNVVKAARDVKCKFYYSVFVDKKFQKPLYENRWNKCFDIKYSN